jgi:ABC-2 type transport system ATP-binding protein
LRGFYLRTRKPVYSDPMIEVCGARRSFGKTIALDGIDLTVRRGSLHGIIGPNGAGKSTLIGSLTGSVKLEAGSVKVMGLVPPGEHLSIKTYSGIVPESETPPSFLKVDELLDFVMEVRGLKPDRSKNDRWVEFFDLESSRDKIAKDLSKGTRQKLMLASALIHEPNLFLLDEPFINLDPIYQKKVKDLLKGYVSEGRTIVLSTHILPLAQELCGTILVIHKGKAIWSGSTKDLVSEMGDLESAFLKLVGYGIKNS